MQKLKHLTLFVTIMIITMVIASCSGSPSELDSTDAPDLSPVEETSYPVSGEQVDPPDTLALLADGDNPASLGSWGVSLLEPDFPEGELVYSGEPVEITFQMRGDATLGVVLFLDGFVQPHKVLATTQSGESVPLSDEAALMSSHEPDGDDGIKVTLSFHPVSGKTGDVFCLAPLFIYDPFYIPENEAQLAGVDAARDGRIFGFNAVVGSFNSPLYLRMAADGLDAVSSYSVEAQALDNPPPDPLVTPDPNIDAPKFFLYSGVGTLTPDTLKAPGGKLDLTVRIAGGLERDYRVTVFVNNKPVMIENYPDFLMHSQFNNKVEYTFPLVLEGYQRLNTLYAVFVPIQDDCQGQLFSGYMTAPILLIR